MRSSTQTGTLACLLLVVMAGAARAAAPAGAGSPAPSPRPGLPALPVTAGPAASTPTSVVPVIYVDVPSAIDLADYLAAWPGLEPYVARLRHGDPQDGIDMGQREFLVIRADVHRVRGDDARAFADYDRAMAERVFKLSSFLAAGQRALEKEDRARANRYYVWATRCRPDSAQAHEGLGDSYAAAGDGRAAAAEYAEAMRLDPRSTSAREKLGRSGVAPTRRPG